MPTTEWTKETAHVYVGKRNGRIIGRIAEEPQHWEWAIYRAGWAADHGRATSFDAARNDAERAADQIGARTR